MRLEVFLRFHQLGGEQALVLVLALARHQTTDLIPRPGEPAPLDAEGARGIALGDGDLLHVGQDVTPFGLDLGEGVFEALQRLGSHSQKHLDIGRGQRLLVTRPAGRGRRHATGTRSVTLPARGEKHPQGGKYRADE